MSSTYYTKTQMDSLASAIGLKIKQSEGIPAVDASDFIYNFDLALYGASDPGELLMFSNPNNYFILSHPEGIVSDNEYMIEINGVRYNENYDNLTTYAMDNISEININVDMETGGMFIQNASPGIKNIKLTPSDAQKLAGFEIIYGDGTLEDGVFKFTLAGQESFEL